MERMELKNFVKFCLEYLKLLRQDVFSNISEENTVELSSSHFSLHDFLKSGKKQKIVISDFETTQTNIKQKLEEIYNKQRNEPYTKQTFLTFGEIKIKNSEVDATSIPLFLINVKIEKQFEKGKGYYEIVLVDPSIQINILSLTNILSENSRVQILENLQKNEESFVIPIADLDIFQHFSRMVKELLQNEKKSLINSEFTFDKFKICILPRVNYFLVNDLENLSKKSEEELKQSALAGWIEEESLSLHNEIPSEGELYFPFPYDQWQLRVLEIIENKISVVQGPPGTGKSQTICNLLCHLAAKGKKVLFTSQTEQALKVVKDMLKTLDIQYLFAYLPDIGSIYLTEQDYLDGVGPQLTKLESYLENELSLKITGKRRPVVKYHQDISLTSQRENFEKEVENLIKEKEKLKTDFAQSIKREKKLFKLFSELEKLEQAKTSAGGPSKFFKRILFALKIHQLQACIKDELKKASEFNLTQIFQNFINKEKEKKLRIKYYLQTIVNLGLFQIWREKGIKIRRALRKFSKAFGKSKKAYKTFDTLRKNKEELSLIISLFPIWIVELDDVSRILPLEPTLFDYVIFDEASQCNIAYALPAMFRAKKALFVGDSEQMRETTILFKRRRSIEEIAKRYSIPEEFHILPPHEHVQSVLDIAQNCGCQQIVLRNHYRSPRELIGFSNQYFYKPKGKELFVINSNYLPFKDTNRIIVIHKVTVDPNKEFSDKINVSEAEAILSFFQELKKILY